MGLLICILFLSCMMGHSCGFQNNASFVTVSPTSFSLEGYPFYVNGFNAYWMPYMAVQNRTIISNFLKQAAEIGLNVARTWAFKDGGFNAMQISLGKYNEEALQGLDYVVSESYKNGIRLILSLVNNYGDLGGRPQYVKWANETGINVTSDDDFYTNPMTRKYYKKYVEMILTRKNSVTGLAYMHDPAIFSWELMNEPRSNDPSGDIVQSWIAEMAAFVKTIDCNHLLEIGLEGFYNAKNRGSASAGSWSELAGTDFLRNNLIPEIDFATVHIYPDIWMPNVSFENQLAFVSGWIEGHVLDASANLSKPVLFAEFGKSDQSAGFKASEREAFFSTVYSSIYGAAQKGLGSAGALLWQLFADEMDSAWDDGFQILISKDTSVVEVVRSQSQRMSLLGS